MSAYKERTHRVKPIGADSYSGWVDCYETSEGGAILAMDFDDNLEFLSLANEKLLKAGIVAEVDINPRGTAFILVDENNKLIPFETVMKAFFD